MTREDATTSLAGEGTGSLGCAQGSRVGRRLTPTTSAWRRGEQISYEEYYPYGATAWWAQDSAAGVSLKRYRYTGMERDEETGLAAHGVRMYAAWLGRWSSTDPAALDDGINRYRYGRPPPFQFQRSRFTCHMCSDRPSTPFSFAHSFTVRRSGPPRRGTSSRQSRPAPSASS